MIWDLCGLASEQVHVEKCVKEDMKQVALSFWVHKIKTYLLQSRDETIEPFQTKVEV